MTAKTAAAAAWRTAGIVRVAAMAVKLGGQQQCASKSLDRAISKEIKYVY
jgi:hypothetical protein